LEGLFDEVNQWGDELRMATSSHSWSPWLCHLFSVLKTLHLKQHNVDSQATQQKIYGLQGKSYQLALKDLSAWFLLKTIER